jgi:large subunit ribosomal protein L32
LPLVDIRRFAGAVGIRVFGFPDTRLYGNSATRLPVYPTSAGYPASPVIHTTVRNDDEGQIIDTLVGAQGRIHRGPPTRPPVRREQKTPQLQSEARLMALPKTRTSRANTHARRSQWKAQAVDLATVTTPEGETVRVPQQLAQAVRKGYVKL